ncbi:MAG: mercuric reductase [Myxococcota bacterium]
MKPTHDAIVIGAGQAGPPVASYLSGKGKRVALVERSEIGGTCLNTGCRPTKAMRASARVAYLCRRASSYGVNVGGDVQADLPRVVRRKDEMIDRWRNGYTEALSAAPELEILRGHAAFTGSADSLHTLEVAGRAIVAETVVLNVGARARIPQIPGLAEVPYLTNANIVHLEELPSKLLIVGGSYIGLEFGQMFRRFGSEVVVLESGPRIASREDPEISASIDEMLRGEGLDIRVDVQVSRVTGSPGAIEVVLDDGDVIHGSHLLLATGRVPNTDQLGLEHVGITTDERGFIRTDGVFRTGVDGIFAIGDVNGRGAFTHTSYQDYEILVDHLEGGNRSADDRIITYAMFTDPPLGRVGMTEAEARATGKPVLSATYPMNQLTKAVLDGETEGLIKILVDESTDRFLGASCFGLFGDEIVQVVSALMHANAPCHVLLEMLPVHPTIAEFYPTILNRLAPLDEAT